MWKGLGKIETNRFILNFVYLRYWFNCKNSKSWFVKRGSIFCGGAASSSGSVFGGAYVHFWWWRTLDGFKQLERYQLIWRRKLPDQFFFGQKVRPVGIICFSFRCFGNLFPWKVQRVPDLIKLPCLRPPKAAASTLVWWVWFWKRFLIFLISRHCDFTIWFVNVGDCRCEPLFFGSLFHSDWHIALLVLAIEPKSHIMLNRNPISSCHTTKVETSLALEAVCILYGVDNFRHIYIDP